MMTKLGLHGTTIAFYQHALEFSSKLKFSLQREKEFMQAKFPLWRYAVWCNTVTAN